MISPENSRPPISPERQAYLQELDLAKLGIRDWADGILSDPDLRVSVPITSSIQEYATWLTAGDRIECKLWRIDNYAYRGTAPATWYHFAVHDTEDEYSSYYRLEPGQSKPKICDENWDMLKTQFPLIAERALLTYLRTSPVDATTMLTHKEVETTFLEIVQGYSKPESWRSAARAARAAMEASRVNALDTLDQMLDAGNEA